MGSNQTKIDICILQDDIYDNDIVYSCFGITETSARVKKIKTIDLIFVQIQHCFVLEKWKRQTNINHACLWPIFT